RLAHDEHVIARPRHGYTKLQSLDRALLAEHTAEELQIIGSGEVELFGGEGAGQVIRRQMQAGSEGFGHRKSLSSGSTPRRVGLILALPRCPWQGIKRVPDQHSPGSTPQPAEQPDVPG